MVQICEVFVSGDPEGEKDDLAASASVSLSAAAARDVSAPPTTSLTTSHSSSSLAPNLPNSPPLSNGRPLESPSKSRGPKPALRPKSMARPRAGPVEDGSAAANQGESEASAASASEGEGKKSTDDLMLSSFEEPRLRVSRILSSSDFADVYGTFDHAPSAYDSEPPAQHHPSFFQPTSSSPTACNVRESVTSSMADEAQIAANLETVAEIWWQAPPPTLLESGSETRVDEIEETLVEKEASFVLIEPTPTYPDPVEVVPGDAKTRAARVVEDHKGALAAAAQTEALKIPELPSSPPLPQLPAEATMSLTDEAISLSLSTSPIVAPAADTPRNPPQSPTRTTPARAANSTQNGRRSAGLERMVRSRPLPDVLRYSDVKRGKTAAERARSYAIKINQLAREDSGVGAWIRFARGSERSAQGTSRSSSSVSPVKFRHSRDEVSSASFPSRGDGYRAQELSYGAFGPQDLSPTTPYPGVLQLSRTLTPSTAAGNKSFFSLGRKNSVRTKTVSSVPPRHITSPRGVNTIPLPPGSRPSGPRMPSAPRTRTDSFGSADSTGSTPHLPSPRRGSLKNVVTSSSISHVDEFQLNSLCDILPQASREALAAYLVTAGHDESLAMTMYLSSERQ